jgi:hypothetical protein
VRNVNRDYIGDKPSKAEQVATRWHQEHHGTTRVDCWCCCARCRDGSPHYAAAKAAALADIAARLEASVASRPTAKKAVQDEQRGVHVGRQRTRSGD